MKQFIHSQVSSGEPGIVTKEVLRNKFAVFRTERRMHTGVSFLKVQIYFFTIPKVIKYAVIQGNSAGSGKTGKSAPILEPAVKADASIAKKTHWLPGIVCA